MLHEILLALAGHSSPVLQDNLTSSKQDISNDLHLSGSERQLLAGIAALSHHHRNLKRHLKTIVQSHPSTVCKAVATSLLQTHLCRFTNRILEVEASILRRDANTVGAYDIVPLAYVVGQFDDWQRPMAWYWELSTFITPEDGTAPCTGAALIDRLRSETQTGFPNIEKIALELSAVADLAWLKQLAAWILHGKLNELGAADFFVQRGLSVSGATFSRHKFLAPRFVTDVTARSILFIGRSLNHIHQLKQSSIKTKLADLTANHLRLLTEITLPITGGQLSQTITNMRASLSCNILQDILPARIISTALQCLQRYLLLSNTDFASCLINEAERHMNTRWQSMDRLAQQDSLKALQGLSLKDADAAQILRHTWKAVVSADSQLDEDEVFDFARKHMTLDITRRPTSRPSTADSAAEDRPRLAPIIFNDLLLASATSLTMIITPPLDLLLASFDIGLYSSINAYLLALRRAQLRLEELWRRNTARRYRPRSDDSRMLRRGWATSSAALLLLSELAAYFGSSVTRPACNHFRDWACSGDAAVASKDPESVSAGHRAFLDNLIHALLLTDMAYLKELRSLLGAVDQVVSLFSRWLGLLDSTIASRAPADSDIRTMQELEKACLKVETSRRGVINSLREVHQHRADYTVKHDRDTGGYELLRVGSLDQLLMKLEFEQSYSDREIQ